MITYTKNQIENNIPRERLAGRNLSEKFVFLILHIWGCSIITSRIIGGGYRRWLSFSDFCDVA